MRIHHPLSNSIETSVNIETTMNKYMYMYMQNVIICLTYDTCTMCRYILSDEQKISIVLPEESVSWWCQWGPQGIYKGLSTRNAIIVQAKYFWRSLVENDTDACSAEQVLESTCQNSIFLLHKFWQALISSHFSKQASGYIKKNQFFDCETIYQILHHLRFGWRVTPK